MYYNNKRLALSIFWIILGAVLMWLSIAEFVDSTYWSGMGGALIAVGAFIRITLPTQRQQAQPSLSYRKSLMTRTASV